MAGISLGSRVGYNVGYDNSSEIEEIYRLQRLLDEKNEHLSKHMKDMKETLDKAVDFEIKGDIKARDMILIELKEIICSLINK